MTKEQLEQITQSLKQTFKKMLEEGLNDETDPEKIGILYLRVLKACNDNAPLAIKLITYALKSNIMDKYGKEHPIWKDEYLKKIGEMCNFLEEYVKTTI
jgi:hypothetical protein